MKNIFFVFLIFLIITPAIAQERRDRRMMDNKIEQLEKVKLIEALNLTEDQSIRFFARRNEHRKEIEKLEMRSEEILRDLENLIEDSNDRNVAEQKRLLNEFLDIRIQIENKRKQFILSLNDILSVEQVSKLVVFEKKFRDEIRKILMKRKGLPK
ncbi:MAG: periplasmic heavy metal sensor [Ignavibacterium sp.]|nr:periplasmic heavy metal sensor [Ignavibacterium sp.]